MGRNVFQQAPIRNKSVVGSEVYSHSGEFSPRVMDFTLPGRGISFEFLRNYRSSRCQEMGPLGCGWTFTYAKRIERDENDILYHDGFGCVYRFTQVRGKNSYVSPAGFYAVLTSENGIISLRQRDGTVLVFERPDAGGRLLTIEDQNENTLKFNYNKDSILVTDSLGRQIMITFDQDRVIQIMDHAKRVWEYKYDEAGCLIEVIQPPTDCFPFGPRIKYSYDESFRLISITDPNGQTFLRNFYDNQNRVVRQTHGNGTFEFQYEVISSTKTDFPIYSTEVRQKNNSLLRLEHNSDGCVVERTLFVSAESLSPEDRGGSESNEVQLTTQSKFNPHCELIEQTYPAGNVIAWIYDEKNKNPCARGNLLRIVRKPDPNVESDHEQITTLYSYEPKFQRRQSITDTRGNKIIFKYDKRGNLTEKIYPKVTIQEITTNDDGIHPTQVKQLVEKFEYNVAGQLIRVFDARGAVTEYSYYPVDDPTGVKGRDGIYNYPEKAGGYLGRIVRDPVSNDRQMKGQPANLVTYFGYNAYGNISTVWDGKENPTHFRYDTHGRLIGATSRQPFNQEIAISYDANGNMIESTFSFDYNEYNPLSNNVVSKSSMIRQQIKYNVLNNIISRTINGGDRELIETFERDANENIIRRVQPLGNKIEYHYDERNLLIQRRSGVETKDETAERYTYTPNGRLRSMINGLDKTTRYNYDGFHRYRGFTNAGGTMKKQWFDEADNVVRIEVTGDAGLVNEDGYPIGARELSLLETSYQYDELNRIVRVDRKWNDSSKGELLSKSLWDEKEGVVSTIVEYDDNHRPSKIWYETDNVLIIEYDGANREIARRDATGESVSVEYDENGNSMRIEHIGPEVDVGEERFHKIIVQAFDQLDRLIERSVNGEPPESFTYNALGLMTAYKNQAGVETQYLHDTYGRRIGQASIAVNPNLKEKKSKQTLIHRVEMDDNNRIVARITATGDSTQYHYDALNRCSAVIYPDGTSKHFERDGNGNIIRIVDQNSNIITDHFDSLNRLVERHIERKGKELQVEQFHYDGLNRIVAAVTNGGTIMRRYDSLSHLIEETQAGRTVRYGYDNAGNRTHIIYPGGQEILKVYNPLKRVLEVRDGGNDLIAQYAYRSSGQIQRQRIGKVMEANFAYKQRQGRLSDVVYSSQQDKGLIDGTRYLYDLAGNRTQEVQLHRGDTFGEGYFYDSANRLVGVKYDVQDLDDINSAFAQEIQYDLSPEGNWDYKTIRDATGQTVARLKGEANSRQACLMLGDRSFKYDENGNRIHETNGKDGDCPEKEYTYDYANRLVKAECLDAKGNMIRTLEYTYDAFGRQLLKQITDNSGKREYSYIWNGQQLIEEWEDGKLSKSFIYGARVNEPVKMIRHSSRKKDEYFYAFNGRGLITALVNQKGKVAERYRYDVFRQPFLSERNGVPVKESISTSPLGNPHFVAGKHFDDKTRLHFGHGKAFDSSTGQFLNPSSMLVAVGKGRNYPSSKGGNYFGGGTLPGGYDPSTGTRHTGALPGGYDPSTGTRHTGTLPGGYDPRMPAGTLHGRNAYSDDDDDNPPPNMNSSIKGRPSTQNELLNQAGGGATILAGMWGLGGVALGGAAWAAGTFTKAGVTAGVAFGGFVAGAAVAVLTIVAGIAWYFGSTPEGDVEIDTNGEPTITNALPDGDEDPDPEPEPELPEGDEDTYPNPMSDETEGGVPDPATIVILRTPGGGYTDPIGEDYGMEGVASAIDMIKTGTGWTDPKREDEGMEGDVSEIDMLRITGGGYTDPSPEDIGMRISSRVSYLPAR